MKYAKATLGQDGNFSRGNFGASVAEYSDFGSLIVRNFLDNHKVTKDLKEGMEVWFKLDGETFERVSPSKVPDSVMELNHYTEQKNAEWQESLDSH